MNAGGTILRRGTARRALFLFLLSLFVGAGLAPSVAPMSQNIRSGAPQSPTKYFGKNPFNYPADLAATGYTHAHAPKA